MALASALALAGASRPALAQVPERVYVGLEGAAGSMLSAPQRDEFGLGLTGRLRVGFRPLRALGIHAQMEGSTWFPTTTASSTINKNGVAILVGAGVRVTPFFFGRGGRPFLDVDLGAAVTGDSTVTRTRFAFGGGLGWLFPIGSVFALGPEFRYGQVIGTAADNDAGRGNAQYWNLGLAIELYFPGLRPTAPAPAAPRPPADADGDRIPDADDRCPAEPETYNDYQDGDGCPDNPDTDGDGIRDPDDRCINEPEDRDGYLDEDGCPDPDNDGDQVPDATDRCPLEAETYNAYQDEDGCPDAVPLAATVSTGRIDINEHVYFDTGRATIQQRSHAILDLVVAALREHPEITRLRVEGNADDTGDAAHNLTLSRERAQAVVGYLRAAGVAARRLTAQGNGSTRPAMQGESDEAHTRNRRVEFVIVSGGASGAAAPTGGRHHRRH